MTAVLGLSAYFHDSAAAVIVDGQIAAAAQEERFTRVKQESSFPAQAVEYCLSEAGIDAAGLSLVAFYEKPLLKFDRILESHLAVAPRGVRAFIHTMPLWLRKKLYLPQEIKRQLGGGYQRRIVFAQHHHSHAASAFYPAPFEQAAVLTVDGVGEWATAAWGDAAGGRIELQQELHFPHSLGLLYSAFTAYCGFRVNSGEYKLMGLAPYGKPEFAAVIRDHLLTADSDGSFQLNMRYFDYVGGLRMTSPAMHRLLGGPPRQPGEPITQRHQNLAASVQQVLEEQLLAIVRHVHRHATCKSNLCLAGGVALNCVANRRILEDGPFENIWIQPAAGDAGGALGAALYAWRSLLQLPLKTPVSPAPDASCAMQNASLGPAFNNAQIRAVLQQHNAVFHEFNSTAELAAATATRLKQQQVVAWFQGRMEFGPRALGNRSILADPRNADMADVLNTRIKRREPFRPFAPAVLASFAAENFQPTTPANRYMLVTTCVSPQAQLPAVTHVDGSARVQTVDAPGNPELFELLTEFYRQTGCPALINTSFNVRGEPIVCTPADALRCLAGTEIDALAIGGFLVVRSEQPPGFFPQQTQTTTPADLPSGLPATIPTPLPLVELKKQPAPWAMWCAGGSLAVTLSVTAALAAWRLNHAAPLFFAAAMGLVLLTSMALLPELRRRVFRFWLWLNYPLAWLTSHVALILVFYLVLTPTALIRRCFGHSPVSTAAGWRQCKVSRDGDHFKQF